MDTLTIGFVAAAFLLGGITVAALAIAAVGYVITNLAFDFWNSF